MSVIRMEEVETYRYVQLPHLLCNMPPELRRKRERPF